MRKYVGSILILVASIFLAAAFAFCDVQTKSWEFSKFIHLTDNSKKAVAIPLDGQVFNSAKSDLSDLRVVGQKGSEHSYAIFIQREIKEERKLGSGMLSTQTTPTESIITAELKDPIKPFNSIRIIPESNNFARKITIEGSNDNKAWEIIRKGTVVHSFAFEMTSHFFEKYTREVYEGYAFGRYSEENLFVQFPEAKYKFVRVIVPHDQDKKPVELKSLEIFEAINIKAEEDIFRGTIIKRLPNGEEKSVETVIDFGSKEIPLSRINMTAGQSDFLRKIEASGSNDLEKWTSIASGLIFSISIDEETDQNMTLNLGDAKFRYLKIKVFNGDNNPVNLTSVTGYGLKRFLVIIPEKDVQYSLLYGNPAARPVSYDLGEVIRGKMIDSFGKGTLAGQVRNDKYVPYKETKPWTEERPYILWIAMIAIILGLIFLGSRVVKNMDRK